jgi:hypothetical protein
VEEIGVRILNEGTDVWVMVPAQHVAANIYVILENSMGTDQDCELEFQPGNLVTTLEHTFADGRTCLVAQRLYGI